MLLLAGPCHVSADQLLQSLRRSGSRISKATVYNTLKAFSRAGIIQEVAVDPSRLVYDSTTTRHHHFLNEDTGELTDIDPAQVELLRLPPLTRGHPRDQRGTDHPRAPPVGAPSGATGDFLLALRRACRIAPVAPEGAPTGV